MRIELNGESHECTDAISVAQLLAERGLAERRVAVEVNQTVVPKSRHGEHHLQDGDRVEIIHALGGG